MKYVFGIDLGGTTVKLGLFSSDANLIKKWEIPTDKSDNGSHILSDIADSVLDTMKESNIGRDDIIGAGIGVPGPVTADGTVNKCINLGWGVFNIAEALSELISIPVKAGNDATVAALGEMWKGGGEGYSNVVLVTLGTGVGAGVTIDGNIVYGTTGSAGEIGHMHVENDETDTCNCGNVGCLEQYASATGIVKMYKKAISAQNILTCLTEIEQVTAKDIFDAAKADDSFALDLVDKYCCYLGLALANTASVVNPEIFVIGGGVSKAGDIITNGVNKHFRKFAFHSCRNAKFALAQLGNDAGIYGAAKMVL